jgi:hypothetical protein
MDGCMTTRRVHREVDRRSRLVPALALLWSALVVASPGRSVAASSTPWTVRGVMTPSGAIGMCSAHRGARFRVVVRGFFDGPTLSQTDQSGEWYGQLVAPVGRSLTVRVLSGRSTVLTHMERDVYLTGILDCWTPTARMLVLIVRHVVPARVAGRLGYASGRPPHEPWTVRRLLSVATVTTLCDSHPGMRFLVSVRGYLVERTIDGGVSAAGYTTEGLLDHATGGATLDTAATDRWPPKGGLNADAKTRLARGHFGAWVVARGALDCARQGKATVTMMSVARAGP